MDLQRQNSFKPEAKPLSRKEKQRFYNSSAWRRRRGLTLAKQPLCRACLKLGRQTPSEIADHISPLWADFQDFITAPLQGLCRDCHRAKLEADLLAKRKAALFEVREHA